MQNKIYILPLLLFAALVSCEKKAATPAVVVVNKPPVAQDTVSGKIYTIAGTGTYGYSGDGGAATVAEIAQPYGVAVDGSGNVYFSDQQNQRVRKVNTQGIISTIAGVSDTGGFSGDGGAAISAKLRYPTGLAIDGSGNVYISDYGNNCIRRVNANGVISTYAGVPHIGTGFYAGDGGPATSAELNLPMGLAVDGSGNLYIADFGNGRIRKINTQGIISTIAGGDTNGQLGDGGLAIFATLYGVRGVAVDASGNIYIATYQGNRIRKVNISGIISTIAGNGFGSPAEGGYSGDGGPATSAEINNPTDVVVDASGNVYIADADNNVIRVVNTSGIISTYAGNGTPSYSGDGKLAIAAGIPFMPGIAIDGKDNLYIADLYSNRVRAVYK